MCTCIKIFCYLVTGCHKKTVKFVEVVPKTEGSATFCAHQNVIKPCNWKKRFGITCSCEPLFKFFSALPDGRTTEYEISNCGFSNFLQTYIYYNNPKICVSVRLREKRMWLVDIVSTQPLRVCQYSNTTRLLQMLIPRARGHAQWLNQAEHKAGMHPVSYMYDVLTVTCRMPLVHVHWYVSCVCTVVHYAVLEAIS